jgi:hypothetical protein
MVAIAYFTEQLAWMQMISGSFLGLAAFWHAWAGYFCCHQLGWTWAAGKSHLLWVGLNLQDGYKPIG